MKKNHGLRDFRLIYPKKRIMKEKKKFLIFLENNRENKKRYDDK